MGKPTYLVALREPNKQLWEQIEHKWSGGRHLFVSETMALIDPNKSTSSYLISTELGFTDEKQDVGVVISLDSPIIAAGRFYNDFWEWIRDHG